MQSQKNHFDFLTNDPNQNYNLLADKFLGIVNKHDHLKKKFVRGNDAPVINRELQKEIDIRSRLRKNIGFNHLQRIKQRIKNREISATKITRKSVKRY